MADSKNNGGCLHSGCICCYTACDFENIVLGCVSAHDCICLRHSFCCAVGVPSRGCGIVTNKEKGEFFKIGCYCMDWGIFRPDKLCSSARQHCCCSSVSSIPWNEDFVPEVVCGACYIQCIPNCGCCLPPPESKALQLLIGAEPAATADPVKNEKMERTEQEEQATLSE